MRKIKKRFSDKLESMMEHAAGSDDASKLIDFLLEHVEQLLTVVRAAQEVSNNARQAHPDVMVISDPQTMGELGLALAALENK